MAGSAAEERIRLKAEAAMRAAFPHARIIHELMAMQGGCRIDLAAVTPDRLVLVEVKSERDVLTRLARQRDQARDVADLFRVVVADKHVDKAREIAGWTETVAESRETVFDGWAHTTVITGLCNAPARLNMLWANELKRVAGHDGSRRPCIVVATDRFTGREIRQRVCAALRARVFPRADPVVLSDLFPEPSVGNFG